MNILDLIGNLGNKIIDLFSKRSRNAEKTQELDEKKLTNFNKCLINIAYILLLIIVLDTLFPKMIVSEWIYNIFEQIMKYMMGGN